MDCSLNPVIRQTITNAIGSMSSDLKNAKMMIGILHSKIDLAKYSNVPKIYLLDGVMGWTVNNLTFCIRLCEQLSAEEKEEFSRGHFPVKVSEKRADWYLIDCTCSFEMLKKLISSICANTLETFIVNECQACMEFYMSRITNLSLEIYREHVKLLTLEELVPQINRDGINCVTYSQIYNLHWYYECVTTIIENINNHPDVKQLFIEHDLKTLAVHPRIKNYCQSDCWDQDAISEITTLQSMKEIITEGKDKWVKKVLIEEGIIFH